MKITKLPDYGKHKNCVINAEHALGIEHNCGRVAHHFLNDPKAKFILTSSGDLLNANHKASTILLSGMLTRLPCGKLGYGSVEINEQVEQVLSEIRLGRSSYQRLLKRQMNEEWAVFEFSVGEFNQNREVLLTISEQEQCSDIALNALAKAFGLTLTESEVVRHMSEAYCPKEISSKMDISTNTVRAHLRSIYSKTGMRGYNRALRLIQKLIL